MSTKQETTTTTTRNPRLTAAVLKQLGGGEEAREATKDIARHGAAGGFPGFTYTRETLAFYQANKAYILLLAEDQAYDMDIDMLEMIAGFPCLKELKLTPWQVAKGLERFGVAAIAIQNAMAWFALEEVSRELNPDV